MRSTAAAKLRAHVRARDGDDCFICGYPIDFTKPPGTFMGPSLEHVVPVAAGGSRTSLENLRLSHAYPCNHTRGAVHDGVDYQADNQVPSARHSRQMAHALATAQRMGEYIARVQELSRREWDAIAGRKIRDRHEGGNG
jgi:hypothetical protein